MTGETEWEQPGRRRIWPVAAGLVVALVTAGAALAVIRSGDGSGELAVEQEATPPPAESSEDGADPPGFSEDGVAAPTTPVPRGDGPEPAPAPGEGWRWLPAAPISPRLHPLSAWTGEEFVVWGGTVDGDPVTDGAAYDPRRDEWRQLPDAPAAMSASSAASTWTGEEVVVWGGTRDDPVAAAYDPAADRWRVVPRAPVEAAGRAPTVVWTGREVLVWSSAGAAYDPTTDRWRALPSPPMTDAAASGAVPDGRAGHHVAAWADGSGCEGCGSLVVWVAPADGGDAWPGAAYDTATDRWAGITAAVLPFGGAALTATWTGEAVVLCCALGGDTAFAVYDPVADRWDDPVDGPVARRTLHTARWIGGELLVWGGRQDRDRWLRGNGAAWDPATGRWRWLAEASPRIPRQLHTAAWTGRELLVWGGYDGREARGDGAALDPFDG